MDVNFFLIYVAYDLVAEGDRVGRIIGEKQKVTTADCTRRCVFKYRYCKVSQVGDRICICIKMDYRVP
jgi:hypothetical protein